MTRRRLATCLLFAVAAAGCRVYEIDTGRRERRGGEAPVQEQRTVGKAGIPVEVFLDDRSLGVYDTDAEGQVRVDLRHHLGTGPRARAHRVEFLIHDPDVAPSRLSLIAPPGR
jgi:hypothetical protein